MIEKIVLVFRIIGISSGWRDGENGSSADSRNAIEPEFPSADARQIIVYLYRNCYSCGTVTHVNLSGINGYFKDLRRGNVF